MDNKRAAHWAVCWKGAPGLAAFIYFIFLWELLLSSLKFPFLPPFKPEGLIVVFHFTLFFYQLICQNVLLGFQTFLVIFTAKAIILPSRKGKKTTTKNHFMIFFFSLISLCPSFIEFQTVASGHTSWTALLEGRMLRWASGPGRLAFTSRPMDMFAVPPSYLRDGSFQPPTALSPAAQRESRPTPRQTCRARLWCNAWYEAHFFIFLVVYLMIHIIHVCNVVIKGFYFGEKGKCCPGDHRFYTKAKAWWC